MYSTKIIRFLQKLEIQERLPNGIEILNPYKNEHIFRYCEKFYKKYYSDTAQRTLILGINPGRFGAGLTGIPFTDPKKLEDECGIKNDLPKKPELSADFIYQVINVWGGKEKFYKSFYFGSVCPLGFTFEGKNFNYYDTPRLLNGVYPFITQSLEHQLAFGLNTTYVYCLGEGKNYKFLQQLNAEKKYFKHIIPLSHPRYIMQYRRKKINDYVNNFLSKLSEPHLFVS